MKKLILIVILSFMASGVYCQKKTITEDVKTQYLKIDTSDTKTVYCEIVGVQKLISKKVTITIDFGQKQSYFTDQRLYDKEGKQIVFNTMLDALNYMSERGWDLHSTMLIGAGNIYTYHFVMQKKIKK